MAPYFTRVPSNREHVEFPWERFTARGNDASIFSSRLRKSFLRSFLPSFVPHANRPTDRPGRNRACSQPASQSRSFNDAAQLDELQ